jgi:hypothetical protein
MIRLPLIYLTFEVFPCDVKVKITIRHGDSIVKRVTAPMAPMHPSHLRIVEMPLKDSLLNFGLFSPCY